MVDQTRRTELLDKLSFVEGQIDSLVDDHWGTGLVMWKQRLSSINHELSRLPELEVKHGRISVFFSGRPIGDSQSIELKFAVAALTRFETVVLTALAAAANENLGERGSLSVPGNARFALRDVARGSFGFIFEEVSEQTDLFKSSMEEAVAKSTSLIAAFSGSDDGEAEKAISTTPL